MEFTLCIVDDDISHSAYIKAYIEKKPQFEECIVSTFSNSSDPKILDQEYKLYFLDIDMPNINGFELATKIQMKYSDAIFLFISGHNDFVYDVFKFSAFYFVRKDHFKEDMEDALRLVYDKVLKREEKYVVYRRMDQAVIRLNDIVYFKKDGNEIVAKCFNNEEYSEVKTMKGLQQEVDFKYYHFCMIEAGIAVNLEYVVRLKSSLVELKNGEILNVSRRFQPDARKQYQRYLMESDK